MSSLDRDSGWRGGGRRGDGPLRRGRQIGGPHGQRGRGAVQGDPVPSQVPPGSVTAASPAGRASESREPSRAVLRVGATQRGREVLRLPAVCRAVSPRDQQQQQQQQQQSEHRREQQQQSPKAGEEQQEQQLGGKEHDEQLPGGQFHKLLVAEGERQDTGTPGRDQSTEERQEWQFGQVDEEPPAGASDPSEEEVVTRSSGPRSRLVRPAEEAVAHELCLPDAAEGRRVHVRGGRVQGDWLAYPAEARADARADPAADQEEAEEENVDDADEATADQQARVQGHGEAAARTQREQCGPRY